MKKRTLMYFNPSCSKCAYALEYLKAQGITPELVNYLEQHPTRDELKDLLLKLGLRPLDIIRTSEPVFQEKFTGKILTDEEWIEAIVKYPVLLQRPILVSEDKARIGRSEEELEGFIYSAGLTH